MWWKNGEFAKIARYNNANENAISFTNANEHELVYRHSNRYYNLPWLANPPLPSRTRVQFISHNAKVCKFITNIGCLCVQSPEVMEPVETVSISIKMICIEICEILWNPNTKSVIIDLVYYWVINAQNVSWKLMSLK